MCTYIVRVTASLLNVVGEDVLEAARYVSTKMTGTLNVTVLRCSTGGTISQYSVRWQVHRTATYGDEVICTLIEGLDDRVPDDELGEVDVHCVLDEVKGGFAPASVPAHLASLSAPRNEEAPLPRDGLH